jgi:hypothetical protein
MRAAADNKTLTPSTMLDNLAQEALSVAKKARRSRKALGGDNFLWE